MTGIICYHIQQYVEKMIKARLTDMGIFFRKTHDIRMLLELFPDGSFTDDIFEMADVITSYCVDTRYDNFDPPKEKMIEAFETARMIVSISDSV